MPAVRQDPRVINLDEDISTIRSAIEKEFELGNDVAIHAHSWGGIATGCVSDLFRLFIYHWTLLNLESSPE